MSNLAKTQAQWNKLFREIGLHFAVVKLLRDVERRLDNRRSRIQILEENDTAASTSQWTLSGVVIGTNTDEDGKLFVRITDETPGANQAQVDLYKATGGAGGDKVATGSGNNGATITLSAANSSGLTGTVKLGTVAASESNDAHHLIVIPDFVYRANLLFDNSEVEHNDALRNFLAAAAQARVSIGAAINVFLAATNAFMLNRVAGFNRSGQPGPLFQETSDDEGEISVAYQGVVEDMRKNMVDEGTAGEQLVQGSTVSAGSVSFDSENQGVGSMTAPSMYQFAADGLITFVCVDETIGAEKFSVVQKIDATGEVRQAANLLTIKRTFSDPVIGIRSAMLERTFELETGSGNDFGTITSWTIDGETSKNTEDGKFYLRVVSGVVDPTKWKIQLFKNSSYATTSMVAESDEAAAGATGVALNRKNGSGLTGTCKIGSAPTDGNTGIMDLQTFRVQGADSGVPDKFTSDVTVSARGEFQDRLDELYRYYLNSDPSSPTIDDSYVSAGTFKAFEVRDA